MSKYIIAERWQTIVDAGTVVASGQNPSPTASPTINFLDASGETKLETTTSSIPNSFQEPDVLLIKRVRIWSPLLSLGLGGGAISTPTPLRILATRRAAAGTYGESIWLGGPLNLGEWVDVNQTLSNAGLPAGAGWTLSASMPDPIVLDASRVPASLIGVALVLFSVQVEIAHTLPGVVV